MCPKVDSTIGQINQYCGLENIQNKMFFDILFCLVKLYQIATLKVTASLNIQKLTVLWERQNSVSQNIKC